MKQIRLVFAPVFLAACAPQGAEPENGPAVTGAESDAPVAFATAYKCGDVTAVVGVANEEMRLRARDETFALRPAVAASGAKYEAADDPSTSFWTKGETALMTLRGETFPECVKADDNPSPLPAGFRARGNEPGWHAEFRETEIALVTNYGEKSLTGPRPNPVVSAGGIRYEIENENIVITIEDRPCADDATGMPHPYAATVEWDGDMLRGCGGNPRDMLTGDWEVEEIDGAAPADDSQATLRFDEENLVSGRASCNSYSAEYELTGEGLTIGRAISTMMACAEPLMTQERRFLDILAGTHRFEIADDGALILHAADGRTIRARR